MRIQQSYILVACLFYITLAGCTHQEQVLPPGGWNPGYWACFSQSLDKPKTSERAMQRLAWRSGCSEYWRLVSDAIEAASGADYVFIVEQLPESSISEYWFVIVVSKAGQTKLFTGETSPFAEIDMGDRAPREPRAKTALQQQLSYSVKNPSFEKVIKAVGAAQVWDSSSPLYARSGDEPTIGQAPIAIHAYQRLGARSVDFVLEGAILTPGAIRGNLDISSLSDPSGAWFGAPMDLLAERDRKHLDIRKREFTETLPARAVLNGVLMLLQECQAKEGRVVVSGPQAEAPRK